MKESKQISIRNSKYAKSGLIDLCNYIKTNSDVTDISNMIMIEIGSYVGDSTVIFASEFKQVICVDPWLNGYDDSDPSSYTHDMSIIEKQFDENVIKNFKNVNKVKDYSSNYCNEVQEESVDVVYIDGIHSYEGCKEDIINYRNRVKRGGFISGHDYDEIKFPGVVKAVKEMFGKPDAVFNDTSWVVIKK